MLIVKVLRFVIVLISLGREFQSLTAANSKVFSPKPDLALGTFSKKSSLKERKRILERFISLSWSCFGQLISFTILNEVINQNKRLQLNRVKIFTWSHTTCEHVLLFLQKIILKA